MPISWAPPAHRNYLRWLIVPVLLLVIAWGVSDVLLGTFGASTRFTIAETEYVPGMGVGMRRKLQSPWAYINSDGFRGSELGAREPGEVRILALGDSVTFGVGLEQGEEWPAQLQKTLRQRGVKATVLNGGTPGYNVVPMLNMLKYYDQRMKLDLVVINPTGTWLSSFSGIEANGLQQALHSVFSDPFQMAPRAECMDKLAVPANTDESAVIPALLRFLSTHSPIAKEIVRLWPRAAQRIPPADTRCPAGFVGLQALALGQMLRHFEQHKLPALVVKPFFAFNLSGVRHSNLLMARFVPPAFKDDWPRVIQLVSEMGRFLTFFENRTTDPNVSFFDPAAEFEKQHSGATNFGVEQLFLGDYVHLSPRGSVEYAGMVADAVIQRGMVASQAPEGLRRTVGAHAQADLRWVTAEARGLVYGAGWTMFACALLSLMVIPAGFLMQYFRGDDADSRFSVAMMGFIVLYAVIVFFQNFSLDSYSVLCVFSITAWTVFLLAAWKRSAHFQKWWVTAFSALALNLAVASVLLASTFVFLALAQVRFENDHSPKAQRLAAWVEYETIERAERPTLHDLKARALEDGVDRPASLVQNLATHEETLRRASPTLAIFLQRVSGSHSSPLNALFAEAFMVSAALILYVLGRTRRGKAEATLLFVGMGLIASAVLTPTPLGSQAVIALASFMVAMNTRRVAVRACLLVVSGGILFFLPAVHFLPVVASLAIVSAVLDFRKSLPLSLRSLPSAGRTAAIVLGTLFVGRVFVFNTTVGAPELYSLLNTVGAPRFVISFIRL